jgi:signal peptidase I
MFCVIYKFPKLALTYEQTGDSTLFEKAKRKNFTEIVYSAFPMAMLIILLKLFFVDVVTIPSASMLPNYPIGSMVFINKTAFGVRSPLTGAAMSQGRYPELGEAVISKFPLNPDVMYIKRVVGLPGDTVSLSDKALTINNIDYPLVLTGQKEVDVKDEKVIHNIYTINIGIIEYKVIVDVNKPFPTISTTRVMEDSFYLLGDNLTGSGDSRLYGSVPWRYLIGSIW